jgi:hypothetical protein
MTISNLPSYLAGQPANSKDNPYLIALKIDSEVDFPVLKAVLNGVPDKYIYLDLPDSTITSIPEYAFCTDAYPYTGCAALTGITIAEGVTSIEDAAFAFCFNLENVTIPNIRKTARFS